MATITIAKVNRQLREGISKKTGKEYSFESLGIAPEEDILIDINGDEFKKGDRWINGISVDGVTDDWEEGDKVKVLIMQKTVTGRDGKQMDVINFKLPDGVEAMVEKARPVERQEASAVAEAGEEGAEVDPDDF